MRFRRGLRQFPHSSFFLGNLGINHCLPFGQTPVHHRRTHNPLPFLMIPPAETILTVVGLTLILCYLFASYPVGAWLLGSPRPLAHGAFWILPAIVAGCCAFLMDIGERITDILSMALFTALILYFLQVLVYGAVFRCKRCGAVEMHCRWWWRRGVHWCKNCGTPYINGK